MFNKKSKFKKKQKRQKKESKLDLNLLNIGYQISSGYLSHYKDVLSGVDLVFEDKRQGDLYKLNNFSNLPYLTSESNSFSIISFPDNSVPKQRSLFSDESKKYFGDSYSSLESFFKKNDLVDFDFVHLDIFSQGREKIKSAYLIFDDYYLELSPKTHLDHLIRDTNLSIQGPVFKLDNSYLDIVFSKYYR